ncbi:hypothetical protein EDD11_008630 [Mortierella claussenii]|nr:hypothetical protein EDD11_008630 [Mortierella claussenii]
MEKSYFEDALGVVRLVLQKRINHAAQISLTNDILCIAAGLRSASLVDQLFLNKNDVDRIQSIFHHSARFNQLDLMSIGEDHVFIIHREMLLQDIHDYLSGSTMGLQRVFVNVDYHLPQPEIMPSNRYRALENYIRDVLLPEVQYRIKSWDQAEQCYSFLAVPDRLSLVTLTGWLLSYPINYVLPGHGRRYSSGGGGSISGIDLSESEEMCDEDAEDEEQDNGRNALANQALVVTRIHLQPNAAVEGLSAHCLLSFSYPAELAERCMDRSSSTPPSPLSPEVEKNEYRFETSTSDESPTSTLISNSRQRRRKHENGDINLSPRLPSSDSFDHNRPLPFSNPDICAAGRSFLTELHSRFQKQSIWKAWEVGQQTVVLPVVAM